MGLFVAGLALRSKPVKIATSALALRAKPVKIATLTSLTQKVTLKVTLKVENTETHPRKQP